MFTLTRTLTFKFGATTYPKGGQYGPLFGRHLDIFYLKSGEVEINLDGITRKFSEGQIGLIYNEHILNFNYSKNTFSNVIWCSTGEINITPGMNKTIKALPSSINYSDDLISLLEMGVNSAQGNEQANRYQRNVLGSAVFAAYAYNASARKKNDVYPASILKVKEFMEHHFVEDYNLNSIAEVFNINPRYLLKLYRQYFHVTPSQYLWNLRTEKALELLFTSKLPISKIAALSGFKNANHFSRYIKEKFQQPPNKLRKNHYYREPERYLNQAEIIKF